MLPKDHVTDDAERHRHVDITLTARVPNLATS